MSRIKNFAHIPVLIRTKQDIDNLKERLNEKIPKATYDELINVLLEKHKNLTFSDSELKRMIFKSRGVVV